MIAGTIKWFTDQSKTDKGPGAGVFGLEIKCAELVCRFLYFSDRTEHHCIAACLHFDLARECSKQGTIIVSGS